MSFIFDSDKEADSSISIDDLFTRNHKRDLQQLATFNKILNRVHTRIKSASTHKNNKFIMYAVPEWIPGERLFSAADCVAYLISKLSENGFEVKYIHPNTLFISWENYIPAYVRTEFKKKTGQTVNERGVIQAPEPEEPAEDATKPADGPGKKDRRYAPISQYRPTGGLVYNKDVFDKLEKKMSNY